MDSTVQKKQSKTWGCLLLVIVLLVLCCTLSYFFSSQVISFFGGATIGKDSHLTRFGSATDFEEYKKKYNGKDISKTGSDLVKLENGLYQVEFSEKELLYGLAATMEIDSAEYDEVGIDIEDNFFKLEIGLEAMVRGLEQQSYKMNVSEKWVKGLYFSFEAEESDDNKNVEINKFTSGNLIIDSILPPDMNERLEESVNTTIKTSAQNAEIEQIFFKKDKLVLTLKQ